MTYLYVFCQLYNPVIMDLKVLLNYKVLVSHEQASSSDFIGNIRSELNQYILKLNELNLLSGNDKVVLTLCIDKNRLHQVIKYGKSNNSFGVISE